jgi:beta-mannosidase
LRSALLQVKAAGMNMLRISGTLAYETPAFHQLCDELGILVWQDFMFANMDYPRDDAMFDAEVRLEAEQLLERLAARCSTALYCGGSETEQQAAMMGLPSSDWQHPLWRTLLPGVVQDSNRAVPYWYSTPGGEGLPFWPHHGCTHYYGVGAYLRSLQDARASGVRFASECLAFANPPAAAIEDAALSQRVPQDNGASWSFADVTRHYVGRFFGSEQLELAEADPTVYAALAARAVAYAMHQTQTHFRDPATPCRGSLIWMLRDLEPGWGWGIIDWLGHPKSGYHALARVWAPRAVWFVDEGLSGLCAVVANDAADALDARLEITLLHENQTIIECVEQSLSVAARSAQRLRVEEVLGRFWDTSDVYRFGPPAFDSIRVRLLQGEQLLSEDTRVLYRPALLNAARAAQRNEGRAD